MVALISVSPHYTFLNLLLTVKESELRGDCVSIF